MKCLGLLAALTALSYGQLTMNSVASRVFGQRVDIESAIAQNACVAIDIANLRLGSDNALKTRPCNRHVSCECSLEVQLFKSPT